MKKVFLTAIALFAIGFANAQDKNEGSEGYSKGSVFATGSVNFGSSKYTAAGNYKEDNFTVAPKVGYFVSNNIALGLGLSFSSSSVQPTVAPNKQKVNTTGFEAFARYYTTPADKFSFFGELSVGYVTADYKSADVKVNGFGAGFAPGLSYFISKNFALEASLGVLSYTSAKADADGAESSTDFQLGLNLEDVNVGLVYKF